MSISKNLAKVLMQYKQEYGLSFEELAQKLNLPKSSTVNYCNGTGNPRADTLELLAERCGMPVTTMVSGQPPGWEQAETIVLAAKELGSLPPAARERAVELFLALAVLFAGDGPA